MRKALVAILLYCFIVSLVLGNVSFAQAQEELPILDPQSTTSALLSLPKVSLLPDHPLYFLKTFFESARIFLTRNPLEKAKLYLNYADKRLVEALKLAEKRKVHISEKLIENYGETIKKATLALQIAEMAGLPVAEVKEKLAENLARQQAVLLAVEEKVTGQAQEAVVRAKMMSEKALLEALKRLKELEATPSPRPKEKKKPKEFLSPISSPSGLVR